LYVVVMVLIGWAVLFFAPGVSHPAKIAENDNPAVAEFAERQGSSCRSRIWRA